MTTEARLTLPAAKSHSSLPERLVYWSRYQQSSPARDCLIEAAGTIGRLQQTVANLQATLAEKEGMT